MRRRLLAGIAALCSVASVLLIAEPGGGGSDPRPRVLARRLRHHPGLENHQGSRRDGCGHRHRHRLSHPDLTGTVVGGTDISGVGRADGRQPVGDDSQHGTMVASLLAGHGHGDGAGVIGVAPAAKLLSVSVGFGVGTVSSDDQIALAVRWAVDNGADVINMSLTRNTLEWPQSWDDAFLYAMEHDVVIVAAAGNRGSGTTEVGAPATMPGVLTVAGVDRGGAASFDASSQGITISVAAPSEELVGAAPGGGYFSWAGTSGATPIVAGLVALVRSAYPGSRRQQRHQPDHPHRDPGGSRTSPAPSTATG